MKEILVVDESAHPPDGKPRLARRFPAILRLLLLRAARKFFASRPCSVSFILIDDIRTRRLNRKYLSRAGTTDVIAFYYDDNPASRNIEGDVFINIRQAAAQCPDEDDFDKAVEKEIFLLAVHGLLHLAGYDDHGAARKARMWRMQNRIVRGIFPKVSRIQVADK
ncbi:MAG: rRNA maturation RNase YbeY [Elusimicrobia bacterium HGW-Elusimicrobia-1]|nr:MAG: rRNA maturation RNase YbeY [Elusimicrobia bacterium HGW-Elusimicrobia-1]